MSKWLWSFYQTSLLISFNSNYSFDSGHWRWLKLIQSSLNVTIERRGSGTKVKIADKNSKSISFCIVSHK